MKIGTVVFCVLLTLAYLVPFIHPELWWGWSVIGLSYPVVFILCILSLIYWLIRGAMRWILLVFLVLIIGSSYHMRLFTYHLPSEIPDHTTTLKILSNNVQIFDLYHSDPQTKYTLRDSIFSYTINQHPDIVCFQEFYVKDQPTTFLTSELFEEQFFPSDKYQRYIYKAIGRQYFGIVIFSKHRIIHRGDIVFDTENEHNYNFCIFVDIVKNNDTFRIYNAHLQSLRLSAIEEEMPSNRWVKKVFKRLETVYPQRANQAIKIMNHIQQSPYPVVLCGDFNDTSLSFVYQQFSSHLRDAFLESGKGFGHTYIGKIPAGRIDYIFHSPELKSHHFTIQRDNFSDHRAISCTISKQTK